MYYNLLEHLIVFSHECIISKWANRVSVVFIKLHGTRHSQNFQVRWWSHGIGFTMNWLEQSWLSYEHGEIVVECAYNLLPLNTNEFPFNYVGRLFFLPLWIVWEIHSSICILPSVFQSLKPNHFVGFGMFNCKCNVTSIRNEHIYNVFAYALHVHQAENSFSG